MDKFGIGASGILVILQIVILVMYYGTSILTPTIPWWVLWMPMIFLAFVTAISIAILIIALSSDR